MYGEPVPFDGKVWRHKGEYVLSAAVSERFGGDVRAYIRARYGDAALAGYDRSRRPEVTD